MQRDNESPQGQRPNLTRSLIQFVETQVDRIELLSKVPRHGLQVFQDDFVPDLVGSHDASEEERGVRIPWSVLAAKMPCVVLAPLSPPPIQAQAVSVFAICRSTHRRGRA